MTARLNNVAPSFSCTTVAAAVLSCRFWSTFPGVFDGAQLLRELPSKSLLSSGETRRFGQVSRIGGPTNQRLQLVTRDKQWHVLFVGGVQIGQSRVGWGRWGCGASCGFGACIDLRCDCWEG